MVGGGGARGAPCKRGSRGARREKGSTNTGNGGEKEKEEEAQLKEEGPSPGPPPSPGDRVGGSPGGGQRPLGSSPGGSRGPQGTPGDSPGPSRPTLLLGAELASYDEVKVGSIINGVWGRGCRSGIFCELCELNETRESFVVIIVLFGGHLGCLTV